MIKLKNIKINNGVIECDIFPEDCKIAGNLAFDTVKQNVTYTLPDGYEWCKNHISHAVNALLEMVRVAEFQDRIVMWNQLDKNAY